MRPQIAYAEVKLHVPFIFCNKNEYIILDLYFATLVQQGSICVVHAYELFQFQILQ